MLTVNLHSIHFIIHKCREFQAQETLILAEDPDPPSGDDWVADALADHGDDVILQEVRSAFDELEPIHQAEVAALMWVGRGDFDASEWDEALGEAKAAWTPRTADYILSTPLAADYLEDGLIAFGIEREEE